eukprot:SAG31_NODE_2110_length_6426_cov_6.371898_8_plen_126_part_00
MLRLAPRGRCPARPPRRAMSAEQQVALDPPRRICAFRNVSSPHGDDSTHWVFPAGVADGQPVQCETGGCEPGRGMWSYVSFVGKVVGRTHAGGEAEGAVEAVEVVKDGTEETVTITFSDFNVTVG